MRREGYEFSVSRPEIIARGGRRSALRAGRGRGDRGARERGGRGDGEARRSAAAGMEALEQRGDRVAHALRGAEPRAVRLSQPSSCPNTRGEGVLHRTVRGYEPWAGELSSRRRRRDRGDRGRKDHRLQPVQHPGAVDAVRARRRPGLRGDDRREKPPARTT